MTNDSELKLIETQAGSGFQKSESVEQAIKRDKIHKYDSLREIRSVLVVVLKWIIYTVALCAITMIIAYTVASIVAAWWSEQANIVKSGIEWIFMKSWPALSFFLLGVFGNSKEFKALLDNTKKRDR